jgi:hypothetical protein
MENESTEFDLHVWAKPETENQPARFTVSIKKNAVCIDMPIDQTLEYIRSELENAVEA